MSTVTLVRASVVALAALSFSQGCEPAAVADSIDMVEYTPLGIDSTSTYATSYSHPEFGSGMAESSDKIVGTEEIGGKMYYKSVWFTDGFPGARPLITYLRRSDEAIYAVSGEEPTEEEHVEIPMRLRVGESWEISRFSGSVQYSLQSREEVEVPAGVFNDCLKVVMSGDVSIGGVSGEMYLCRGVGMARQVERFANGAVFEYKLVRREPGRPTP